MFDVVCIGNATMDVFVHLAERHLRHGELCLVPGSKMEADEIFFATGGGATNTAVSFSRLGLKTGIICALGKDDSAEKILKELKQEEVDCRGIVKLPLFKTAYSVILTGFGDDRIILTFGGATTHLEEEREINWKYLEKANCLYIGSFHSRPKLLSKIFEFAFKKGIPIAWNPGKSELKQGLSELRPLLEKTSILFLNREEARMLAGSGSVKLNLKKLQSIVPVVVITLGADGSIVYNGRNFFTHGTHKVKVVDSTGCGDAFNSSFLAATIRGKTIHEALSLATENSESVLQYLGAKNRLLRRKL